MTAAEPEVLFICTGNICRSPVAEIRTRALLAAAGRTGIRVASAGTRGVVGEGVHPQMARCLAADGIDPSGHVARRVRKPDLQQATLIIGMEQEHVDAALRLHPGALRRTFTLPHLAALVAAGATTDLAGIRAIDRGAATPEEPGLADPIGGAPEEYAAAYSRISAELDRMFPLLQAG